MRRRCTRSSQCGLLGLHLALEGSDSQEGHLLRQSSATGEEGCLSLSEQASRILLLLILLLILVANFIMQREEAGRERQ
jgi:hypothetical protein